MRVFLCSIICLCLCGCQTIPEQKQDCVKKPIDCWLTKPSDGCFFGVETIKSFNNKHKEK